MNNNNVNFVDKEKVWMDYVQYALNPDVWYFHSELIKNSGDILYEQYIKEDNNVEKKPSYHNYIRLTYGYSLENLMKGILIKTKKESDFENGFPPDLKNHNLKYLYKLLIEKKLLNSESDRFLHEFYLKLFTSCIESYGRYPIPTNKEKLPKRLLYEKRKYKDIKNYEKINFTNENYLRFITEDEIKYINSLTNYLKEFY